jgi:hypothetical protein
MREGFFIFSKNIKTSRKIRSSRGFGF